MPGAESFRAGAGEVGVLLCHGFTGSPASMRPWAGYLAERGYRVAVPRLPGHGTHWRDLNLTEWTDWYARAEQEFNILRRECRQVFVTGLSMGGALALSLTCARPDKVTSVVVAGTMGLPMPVPQELDDLWGYQPDRELTRTTLETLAYDKSLITEELIDLRMEASSNPPTRESYEAMFPAPRDRWVEDLALSQEEISSITQPVLLIHGLEDPVIPFADTSLKLIELLPDGEMHVFGQCKHWPMVEYADKFNRLVIDHVTPD